MNKTLCTAIQEKRILELRYHGYSRIVEPHAYGRTRKGEEMILCYQLAGGSESGERAGWKLLRIDDTLLLHLTETTFPPRPDYQRDDKALVEVFTQL